MQRRSAKHKVRTAVPEGAAWHSRLNSLPTMLMPSCFDIEGEHPWLSLCEDCSGQTLCQLSSDGFVQDNHVPSALRSSYGSHPALVFPRSPHQMTLLLSNRLPVWRSHHQVAVKVSCSASGSQLAVLAPETPVMQSPSTEPLSAAVMEPARPGTLTQSQADPGISGQIATQLGTQIALQQVPSTMREAFAVFAGSTTPRLIVAGILSLLAWRVRSPFFMADLVGACMCSEDWRFFAVSVLMHIQLHNTDL